MKELPRMARGRRHRFFEADGVDELLSMVLELTAEISVTKERQFALERILEANGIDAGAEIERWMPSADEETRMAEVRQEMLARVLRTLDAEPRATDLDAEARDPSRDRAA